MIPVVLVGAEMLEMPGAVVVESQGTQGADRMSRIEPPVAAKEPTMSLN